jgi:putative membrane protein insertion efficiency factor
MSTEHLDHPPSSEELARIYMQSEENDPRSLLYKRVLCRPKIPVGKMFFLAAFIIGAGIAIYFLAALVFHSILVSIVSAVLASVLVAVALAKQILIVFVKTYQALAPDKVRNRCRYEPSCSVYMIQAVEKYGFWRGVRKGLKRWRGCKPPNGGVDFP